MMTLPDPRTFDSGTMPGLLASLSALSEPPATWRQPLDDALHAAFQAGDDATLFDLMRWRGPPWLNRIVRAALQSAIDANTDAAVRLQVFALPVVIVAGTSAPIEVPLTLHDVDGVRALFIEAGAMGPQWPVNFHAGLCDETTLDALSPSGLYQMARLLGGTQARPDLCADPLFLPAGQTVSLRFLVGTHLVAHGAPAFTETAGDISRWGGALTRHLARRFAPANVTLLPLARPPVPLLAARALGRFCREEVAFQLSLGDALRDLRSAYGEARARVACTAECSVQVELATAWSQEVRRAHWMLDDECELQAVCGSVEAFLSQCGVEDLQVESSPGSRV